MDDALNTRGIIYSGLTRRGKGDDCPRAQRFGGAKLSSECYVTITKCQMSAHVRLNKILNASDYYQVSKSHQHH